MSNLNKVLLIGRLVSDPELRQTNSNIPVCKFTLAINRKTSKGEDKQADFIEVVVFRNTAEFVSKYFKKGTAAFVSGSIQVNTWKDKDGQNRKKFEVVADEVQFAESKTDKLDNFVKKNEDIINQGDFEEVEDPDSLPF